MLRSRAPEALLDTYAPERMAFAQRLIATTDRGFTVATSPTARARVSRVERRRLQLGWAGGSMAFLIALTLIVGGVVRAATPALSAQQRALGLRERDGPRGAKLASATR